jgi:hypothetical protein
MPSLEKKGTNGRPGKLWESFGKTVATHKMSKRVAAVAEQT